MGKPPEPDWDPKSPEVLRDPHASYDAMRERCPVAHSSFLHWSLFQHEDVTRVLHDHETFSNAVSQHLSVPNGMDPPEHTEYRRIIEPYFAPDRMAAFEPTCRKIAVSLLHDILNATEPEWIDGLALPFAVQVQCAFLGWPADLCVPLQRWTQRNYQATLAQDRQAMAEIAEEFQQLIDEMLQAHAEANPAESITAALLSERVWGRPLNNQEIASILRNWTVGEIGTISASVGILLHFLAQHPDLQNQLRTNPSLLPAAIDEILRIHGPLIANRRVTKCPVEIGGRQIDAGERLSIIWPAANRDSQVFEDPHTFRLDRDPSQNLLYGAGIHVCPGAPLARMEMRVIMEETLQRTSQILPHPKQSPTIASYPASGFSQLPLHVIAAP